jgi:hypothetical protein
MLVLAKTAPNLTSFYGAFTPVCFTLLGLWLVVVQTRHSEWRRSPAHRSRAYTLSANFAMPGMMGLLSLVDPGNSTLWRSAFAAVSIGGVLILGWTLIWGPGRGKRPPLAVATTWFSCLLYVVIALVALAPRLVKDLGIALTPLEIEELLLAVLVFVAVNVAWFLMFDEGAIEPPEPPSPPLQSGPESRPSGT